MALSFEESKKQMTKLAATPMTMSLTSNNVATIADDGNWTSHSGYPIFSAYVDERISQIDSNKNITVDSSQVNITQEANSQFVPFEMDRYYDGIDLVDMEITVHFTNSNGHGWSKPVNVKYNDNKIRFAWLVDSKATSAEGKLRFEIHADGIITDTKNNVYGYRWKSKYTDSFNVLKSICHDTNCDNTIVVDDDWVQEIIESVSTSVAEKVAEQQVAEQAAAAQAAQAAAETAAAAARTSVSRAQEAANQASTYAQQAASSAESIKAEIDAEIDTMMQKVETEIDTMMQGIDAEIDTIVQDAVDEKFTASEYATEQYVDDSVARAAANIPINMSQLTDDVGYLTTTQASETYTTKDYVDTAIADVDVTEQLTDYALKSDIPTKVSAFENDVPYLTEHQSLEGYATEQYVQDEIAKVDVSEQLADYAKSADVYTKAEVDAAISNADVDLSDYYTKTEIDSKVDVISSAAETATSNVSSLSKTVTELQATVNGIDTSQRLSYDVKYNDTEDADVGENVFAFYEITNEGKENEVREIKQKFTIVGGGGGSSTSSSLKIGYVTTSPLVVTVNDNAIIKYTFSGTDSSGDAVTEGNATWKVGGAIVATETVVAGENSFDVTDYLSIGTQKVNLTVVDDAGSLVSKNWTVQKIDVRLDSTFNDKLTYPIGPVSFDYTPYGAIAKDIHFVLDGKELGTVSTTASGIPMAYDIPAQNHGAHLLEAYITTEINSNLIESNRIVRDIIWYDPARTAPVIGCTQQKFTARQYDATNITYVVYDPSTETPTVTLAVDGTVVSTQTLTGNVQVWQYKTDVVGDHVLTITCGQTVKTLNVTIEKLDIDISPVTAGLAFDFNPSGKSNNDADRIWSYGTGDSKVSMTVSDNFDWVNGGYQIDANGDQYFCIKAGTSAEIDYELFADDAKRNGKEFKLVFKTTNVAKPDATFLSCMDNTTGSDHIGIQMDVHEAFIYGQAGNLNLSYSEEDVIEFEFNINKSDTTGGNIPMVMGYEDGVSTRPMVYDDSYNFTQNTPKIISLGSEDCDLHIYRFKVYNASLTDRGILNNFIADARNASEMIQRYDRNQIYDENQNLDPDVLAAKCPWVRVYKLSAPYFTNNKSDKVPNTTIQQIYKNGDAVLDNWTCYNCMHSGQGTSSNNYGAAGRNLDFIMNKSGIDGIDPYFKLGDGTETDKITLTRASVPVAYLNAKVNIASSNNMTNAMLANRYNEFNPYNRPFIRDEGVNTSFIKDTMEFHNCVIFIQETDKDVSTHREFADNEWHFYAIGNIGDSKKTDETRLTDMNDKYECCVEIMDVELPLSDFPVNTMYNAMGYNVDEKTKEKIYIWAKNENLGILHELIDGEYVLTEDTEVDLNKTYYVDILEHDDFSEDFTYGWRYIYKGDDEEENAEVFDYCKQKWIEFYRFVTTSTDAEFKAHIGDYVVIDSILYYYLFTTRYCMVDNRAKNLFFHYGKTNEIDSDGNPIRKWDLNWDYDNDTACGLNNYGKQVYRYGLEDIDVDEKGEEVFRESDSTFFCRVRDLFPNELKTMYNTLESKNAWHAESFINKADAWQSEFPEELWRVDIVRKYIRTYNESFISGKGDAQFLVNMSNGKMKYHRRQWERSQEKYMASKYQSSVASGDNSVFRCSVPNADLVVAPNYRLKLTPYAYMYLNVKYGTQNPIQLRAEPNITYEIPFEGSKADIVDVYSSSLIQDFGDLSSCYVATADTSKATKVKKLIFGNSTPGYDNPNFTTLTTGANYLLEILNIENVSGLTQSLNLSALNNLRELYAHGSNIGGVTFADGGRIEIAELPAINAVTMKNLMYLTTLDIADFSRLTTLIVENCSTVDLISMLNNAPNINRARITGVNWTLETTALLEKLYTMKGIDSSGYNADQSVVSGDVHVSIIREQQLYDYQAVWPDLNITANTIISQYPVTFMNTDGTVLEVQYVNKGEDATDPVAAGRIPTPTQKSTVSTNYTFAGWDVSLTAIFSPRTITAIYTETTRRYTVKYVSKGITLQESTGLYGDYIEYTGTIPTYTLEETGYKYYLFKKWDKSGYIDGNKTINAIFDEFAYNEGYYDSKQLSNLSNVEIYALSRLGLENTSMLIEDGDDYSIRLGYDVDFDDIESQLIIADKMKFDGTNYIDTGIQLFQKDRDFVLALDYEYLSGNSTNAVLAQCFKSNGSSGFKLWFNNSSNLRLHWGSTISSNAPATQNNREMLVLRHKSGEDTIYVYKSNFSSSPTSVAREILTTTKSTMIDSTLVLGCAKEDDGEYTSHSIVDMHWCKVWYKDLGDSVCRKLANWTHEKIGLEVCGKKRFYLTEDPSKRSMFSLLATHLLERARRWNSTSSNTGGWASSELNSFLNSRLYEAMPIQTKLLLKRVTVPSSIGNGSNDISTSECYITIPAAIELSSNSTFSAAPYVNEMAISNGKTISYMTSDAMRKRTYIDGTTSYYWTRSPSTYYTQRVCTVDSGGYLSYYNYGSSSSANGVLIELSF